ncbi:multi-sensor signal transduction histidine kinase [Gloeothece citriformis PCC 7424]|uniref:histidine kinase n=1 Tax=Gloeothece citriformis (strain PCC 7424) TaxID=65393 RepID=B7KJ62_GLOC7|nr:response regulator [Gloeothece citriformis]ACK72146.1 multi-sensor signal transduction histidine kinase [Gloeothece citriformis PCC 7424]
MSSEPNVNILLVDDNPNNLLALEAILNSLGQNLVRATSGEDALRCLLQQDFAVILLDVKMPGMDGFETAMLIRERQRSRHVPIIFLTAYSKSENQAFKGYSLGAVDYLVKPIEPEILLSKVTVFVDLFKKTAQVKQQAEEIAQLNEKLEQRVIERTAQLEAANRQKEELFKQEKLSRIKAEAAEQRFRDLINGLGHVIFWEADAKTFQFTFVSQSAEMLLGYTTEKWLSEPEFWTNILHPEDRNLTLQRLYTTSLTCCQNHSQGKDNEFEYRCITAKNEVIWIRDKVYLVYDEQGVLQKLRGLMIDITESKKAEEALRSQTEELARLTTVLKQTNTTLEKRNHELDQFVYVASHDLKSPLRAIANISQWLAEDLEDKLTEETQHQLDLLQGRVLRMEKLINGLLYYYRVGRVKIDLEKVEVEELLKEVISSLDPPPEFTIKIDPPMPTINTIRVLLEQVFSNLISNAIKHHHLPEGTIIIKAENKGKFYEFSVADDGPGIAPEFHEKVFGLFQTLKAKSNVENTGIGLTLVKRIVEGEKGKIYLKSEERKGTTVYFTWPVGN